MYRCVWCFTESGYPIADHILMAHRAEESPV